MTTSCLEESLEEQPPFKEGQKQVLEVGQVWVCVCVKDWEKPVG